MEKLQRYEFQITPKFVEKNVQRRELRDRDVRLPSRLSELHVLQLLLRELLDDDVTDDVKGESVRTSRVTFNTAHNGLESKKRSAFKIDTGLRRPFSSLKIYSSFDVDFLKPIK